LSWDSRACSWRWTSTLPRRANQPQTLGKSALGHYARLKRIHGRRWRGAIRYSSGRHPARHITSPGAGIGPLARALCWSIMVQRPNGTGITTRRRSLWPLCRRVSVRYRTQRRPISLSGDQQIDALVIYLAQETANVGCRSDPVCAPTLLVVRAPSDQGFVATSYCEPEPGRA
jgi:hypothetical protein